jgi:hypothetical protein
MATVNEVDAKINSHIDICSVRYEGIEREMRGVNARLKRLETILISAAWTTRPADATCRLSPARPRPKGSGRPFALRWPTSTASSGRCRGS